MRIEIEIGELVLHGITPGLSRGDREAIGAAVRQELEHILVEAETPSLFGENARLQEISAQGMWDQRAEMQAGVIQSLGSQIAGGIFQSFQSTSLAGESADG